MMYPIETLSSNIRFSAAQLATTAPTQYQEYDCLRSEVEVRVAVAPPLVALAIVLTVRPRGVALVGTILVSALLLLQAAKNTRAVSNILANAAYLEQLKIPSLEGLAAELEKLDPKPQTTGAWLGAMIIALEKTD